MTGILFKTYFYVNNEMIISVPSSSYWQEYIIYVQTE
jgi:hypothetical protein